MDLAKDVLQMLSFTSGLLDNQTVFTITSLTQPHACQLLKQLQASRISTGAIASLTHDDGHLHLEGVQVGELAPGAMPGWVDSKRIGCL